MFSVEKKLPVETGDLPYAEKTAIGIISLAMYASLTGENQR